MCRRRLFKSNFYINYGGTKKAHGETVIVSPFVAGGGQSTFELHSRNPWVITNSLSWLTVSSLSDKSGKYAITITAAENQAYGERSGSFTAKTLDDRFSIVVSVSQQAKDNVTYRNLTVDPTSLTLGSDDARNGKTLKAYVDEYVNGVYHERVDVTLTSNWTSADNSIATVTGGSYAVVKPVYGSGFFPDERTTTITAVYNGSTTYEGTNRAICNVTVEPEGYVTHYISVEPTTATINSTGEVQLTVLYHTVTDGVDDGGIDATTDAGYTDNGSNLIDVNTTGKVSGSGAETGGNATVTVSYPGVESVDVPITVRNASTEEYLEITPSSTSTTWNGEVEYSVYYVKKVNGQEATRVKITNPDYVQFTLSDDTAGKMNDFMFEAENISTSNKTVEISAECTGGAYSGITTKVPATLTVNGADSVDYRLDVEAVPTSIAYSGSSQLYASAVTVVNGSVYKWYVPDDVVWNENSTAITIANGTATGMHTGTSSTNAVITGSSQSFGKNGTVTISIEGRPAARLTIDRDNTSTVSSAAGQCNYYISWAYLKPGTTITLTTDNLSNFSPTSITITESNYISGNREIVVGQYTENPNTYQRNLSLSGVAQTYYDGTARDYHYYTQEEKETPAVITYELEITPTDPGTKPYSGSQAFVATLYRITNGTRDGWSENVTEYVDWAISTDGGDFIKSGITTGGTAEWVNLSSSTGQVTVSAWLNEPEYGSPSSNEVVFTVNGVSITSTLTLTPVTTTLEYGESVTYTATVTIRHGSTEVFSQTYTFNNWDSDVLSIAPDSNTYLTHDVNSKFDYSNASEQETSVTITCSYRETVAEFLPSGAHVDGTAQVTLNEGGVTPPVVEAHIYIDGTPDEYEASLNSPVSYSEDYELTWSENVNPETLGCFLNSETQGTIENAEVYVTDNIFSITGNYNTMGEEMVGKVYLSAYTYDNQTVSFEFTLRQPSLSITEISINGDTEKYLMLSGQMISFEVQDQNGNTLQSGTSPTNYYAALLGNGVNNDLAIWGYESGKTWVICKHKIVTKRDYSIVFYTRESGGDVNVRCSIHCVPITLTATPNDFPQSGGTGTLSIKTYGNYNWSVYDDPEELLDMSVTGTSVGQGDTDGIGFVVYENMSEDYDSDYFYAVVNVVDEYGNSLRGEPRATIDQETYTPTPPTPVRTTDAIICLSARSESCVTVNTGIEIRYDNLGDMMGDHSYGTPLYNDFHISVPSLNTYANAEAYIVIFGHYFGSSTEKFATGDTEYLATMEENTSSRLVTLLGNDPGHSYQNAFVANNDIVEVIGEIQEGQAWQIVIDDIQFVTSPRGKTIHASSFAPQQFTLTYENPIAKITAVTFDDDYTPTVWTDNTGGTAGFGFTVNYDQIDELIISWDVNGITGATFVDGDKRTRISNGDSVSPTNLSGTVSFSSLGLATNSGKVYIEGRYLGVTKEQFELPIIYEEPED